MLEWVLCLTLSNMLMLAVAACTYYTRQAKHLLAGAVAGALMQALHQPRVHSRCCRLERCSPSAPACGACWSTAAAPADRLVFVADMPEFRETDPELLRTAPHACNNVHKMSKLRTAAGSALSLPATAAAAQKVSVPS